MKKNQIFLAFFCFGFCLFSQVAFAQKTKALVVQFEHLTANPLSFPDYFHENPWTDSLLAFINDWMRNRFRIEQVDFKIKNPVSYIISSDFALSERSLRQTDYEASLSIVSLLQIVESHKSPEKSAELSIHVMIKDKKGRNLFKNQIRTSIKIEKNNSFYSETLIDRQDFQKIYRKSLEYAFKIKEKPESFFIRQSVNQKLKDFVTEANKFYLKKTDRSYFEFIENDTLKITNIDFSLPLTEEKQYLRTCTYKNLFNQKVYILDGTLKENYPEYVSITIQSEKKSIGIIKSFKNEEVFQLRGKIREDNVLFTRSLQSGLIRIEINGILTALFKNISSIAMREKKSEYEVYFLKNISPQQKADILDLLAAESLTLALQKYYEVETKE